MLALIRLVVLVLLGFQISCSVNILEEFGDTETDFAKYIEAQKLVSKTSYVEAINVIGTISDEYQARADVKTLLASAYAGRCGLDFLNFVVNEISNIGSTRLYPFLMSNRASLGVTADNQSFCSTAISLLQEIGATGAVRSDDQNIFMAAVSFIQIGVILSKTADTDNDGTLDGTFDACSSGNISDTDIDAYGAALMIALESVQAVSNPAFGGDQVTVIANLCTLIGDPDICSKTDGSFDATERNALRSLIKEDNAIGLGAMCTGDIATCNCP